MKVVYLCYGDRHGAQKYIYYETFYSILTYLHYHEDMKHVPVYLYTTDPSFFEKLAKVIHIVKLDPVFIEQCRKRFEYEYLVKLEVLKNMDSSFLYFDSDTIIGKSFKDIMDGIDETNSAMCEYEYDLDAQWANRVYNNYYIDIARHFNNNVLSPKTKMYNSGCLGMHKTGLKLIPEMVELAGQILKVRRIHSAEQLAVSAVLAQHTTIHEAKDRMIHYWKNKEAYTDKIAAIVRKFVQKPELTGYAEAD